MAQHSRSLYSVLGVTAEASVVEISHAYRRLALRYHPDRNPDGAETFKEISNASAVLTDPDKRAAYDLTGIVPGSAGSDERTQSPQEHSAELKKQVDRFYSEYARSAEEKEDFIHIYNECSGNFSRMVRAHLLFDNGKEEEVRRLCTLGSELIRAGQLHTSEEWLRTTTPKALSRLEKKMMQERKEAEAALEEMGLASDPTKSPGSDLMALQALMKERQQASWQSMVQGIEAKYTKQPAKRSAKKSVKDASSAGSAKKKSTASRARHAE